MEGSSGYRQLPCSSKCSSTASGYQASFSLLNTGDIITMEEADKREEEYRANKEGCFILHINKDEAIDGNRQFPRIVRLVNHAAKNANIKLHNPVTINGVKRVALVASRDISGMSCSMTMAFGKCLRVRVRTDSKCL